MLHATGRGIARLPNAALPVQSYLPQPLPDLVQPQRWLFARIIHHNAPMESGFYALSR